MGVWDYAYNPYRLPAVRNYVRPYLRLGFKQLGLSDYSDKAMDIAESVGDMKIRAAKRVLSDYARRWKNRTKKSAGSQTKRKLDFDSEDEKEDKGVQSRSFRNLSNEMGFNYKLRRGKRPRKKDKFKSGVVYHMETRGKSTAVVENALPAGEQHGSKCDFGHHSTPLLTCLEKLFMLFVRRVAKKNGVDIVDYERKAIDVFHCAATPTHSLDLGIRVNARSPMEYISIDLSSVTETVRATAYRWYTTFQGKVREAANNYDTLAWQFVYIDYQRKADSLSLARISLQDSVVVVHSYSTLRMQNRTLGESGTDTQVTDITNNPVEFRSFDVRGNAVMFCDVNPEINGSQVDVGGAANAYTGFIPTWNTSLTSYSDHTDPRDLKHLLGCGRKIVKPGDYYTSVLRYKRKIKLDELMKILFPVLKKQASGSFNGRVALGVSRVFEVDKYLHTMAGNQPVDIGIQLNTTLCLNMYTKKQRIRRWYENRGAIIDPNTQGAQTI